MSIERNHARRDSEAVAQRQLDAKQADRNVREAKHEQPMAERVDRFAAAMQKQGEPKKEPTTAADQRALMQQQGQKTKTVEQSKLAAEQAAREQEGAGQPVSAKSLDERSTQRKQDSKDSSSGSESSHTDAATLWQSQMALRNDATQMPAQAAPVNTQMFSELIQKHVRQMAASDSAGKGSDGQVLLRMSDATLPGTDLLLSRTETGWTLRADSRSRDSYDAIRRAAPDLAQRFADGDLGDLTIEPYFHG